MSPQSRSESRFLRRIVRLSKNRVFGGASVSGAQSRVEQAGKHLSSSFVTLMLPIEHYSSPYLLSLKLDLANH
jgi:hypothetical protein